MVRKISLLHILGTISEWLVLTRQMFTFWDRERNCFVYFWSLNRSWLLNNSLRRRNFLFFLRQKRKKNWVNSLIDRLDPYFSLVIKLVFWDMLENRAHVIRDQVGPFLCLSGNPWDWLVISHSFNNRAFILINSWNWLRFFYRFPSLCDINLFDRDKSNFLGIFGDENIANI